MTPLPANPFMPEQPTWFDERFIATFFEAIEPMPAFLRDPSPEYLSAAELMPIVKMLTAYR